MRYDQIYCDAARSCSAVDKDFAQSLRAAVAANKTVIKKLVADLAEEGFADPGKWHTMPQGYVSNTVHTLAHLLDGFFGIDSKFYNLIDDSHQVSMALMEKIDQSPQEYWLVKIVGSSERPDVNRVPFLRK